MMTKETETLFAFPEESVVHNFYKCTSGHCQHLTTQEQSRIKPSSWLFDKGLNVCWKRGLAWLVYQEGKRDVAQEAQYGKPTEQIQRFQCNTQHML